MLQFIRLCQSLALSWSIEIKTEAPQVYLVIQLVKRSGDLSGVLGTPVLTMNSGGYQNCRSQTRLKGSKHY